MDEAQDRITTGPSSLASTIIPFPSRILLRRDLWFDPALAILQRQGKTILLTAREAAVLKLLLQTPRGWHSADDLAGRLRRRWAHINAHSIEQTITGLRRKLGESGKHPTILLNRYDLGYGIFPQDPTDASS